MKERIDRSRRDITTRYYGPRSGHGQDPIRLWKRGAIIESPEATMKSFGFDEVRVDGFGNLFGRIGSGPELIAIDGHADTVDVGNPDIWDVDPFGGVFARWSHLRTRRIGPERGTCFGHLRRKDLERDRHSRRSHAARRGIGLRGRRRGSLLGLHH